MSLIGASLSLVEPGVVEIALPFRADLTQQHGYLHAGVVTTIADSACGYAAYSLMPSGSEVLSVEFKVNLLRPAAGDNSCQPAIVRAAPSTPVTVADDDAFLLDLELALQRPNTRELEPFDALTPHVREIYNRVR